MSLSLRKRRFPTGITLGITVLLGGIIYGAFNLQMHGSLLPNNIAGYNQPITKKMSSLSKEARSLRASNGEKMNIVPWSHKNLRRLKDFPSKKKINLRP